MSLKKRGIRLGVIAILSGALYGVYRYYYPFGMVHRCDKCLWFELRTYAEQHGGAFPAGQNTPEASLGLLGAWNADLLRRRDVSKEVVWKILDRGEALEADTCGWNYVEGLRLDSNPKLALFWDKEGLDEMGGRLREGGHYVSLVGWPYNYIPASEWDGFLDEQRKLLAEETAKRQSNEQPRRGATPHQPGG